jgi:hypothetical protein
MRNSESSAIGLSAVCWPKLCGRRLAVAHQQDGHAGRVAIGHRLFHPGIERVEASRDAEPYRVGLAALSRALSAALALRRRARLMACGRLRPRAGICGDDECGDGGEPKTRADSGSLHSSPPMRLYGYLVIWLLISGYWYLVI